MNLKLTKIFQKVPEGYIGFVEELPGANTQGETLEETKVNLEEAIELVMETNRQLVEEQIKGKDVIREAVHLSAASDFAKARDLSARIEKQAEALLEDD